MSLRSLLRTEWLRLKVRTWLLLLAGLGLGGLIGGLFFVRRQLVEFRPEHSFNVRSPEFFASAHALGDPLPVQGNRLTLLQNGDEFFPAMLEAIRGAQHSVHLEAFIFNSDPAGQPFIDALKAKAQSGVTVRLMVDGIGSSLGLENHVVKELRQAGVEFAYYHPMRSVRLDKLNRRSHRRILVVDGRVGFTGGAAMAEEWLGHAQDASHWRDLHLKVEGPLVAKLQGAFQQHWLKETDHIFTGPDVFPEIPSAGELKAQVIASTSYSLAAIPMAQAVAIAAAEQRIWITNAYCTPTHDQVYLLGKAVARGVDVRLLVPGKHNDQPATKAVGRNAYGQLLQAGVKIYEYVPTMIHQKTMVVDGLFCLLGTSNLDARSAQINEEIDVSIYDEKFGHEMERVFTEDLAHARLYTLEEYRQRGLWERFTEWALRPIRSQL